MQRTKRVIFAAAAAAVSSVSFWQFKVQGATFTWSGAGTDDNLSNTANWVGNVAPSTSADFVAFSIASPPRTTPSTNGGAATYGTISFLAGIPAFNIGGSNPLTIGVPGTGAPLVNNTAGVDHTFSSALNIVGGTINMAAGGFVFSGPVNIGNGGTANTNNVTVIGGSTVSFSGGLASGGASLNFGSGGSGNDAAANFTGLALLSTDNSAHNGQIFINGGVVRISNGNALGSGTVTTQLSSGGTGKGMLELTGDITVNTNIVNRARSGIGSIMLRNVSGNNTLNNVFTDTGGSTFSYESAGGNLTIASWNTTKTGTGRFLNLSGAGNGQINNWTPASGATITLNKSGAGNWILGTGMNNTNGSFVAANVTGGTLTFDTGLGARMTGSATISTGGAVEVRASGGVDGEIGNGTTPTTILVQNGGTFDATTFTQYNLQVSQTFIGGGTVKVGQIGFFGDSAVYIGNNSANSVGTFTLQGNANINHSFPSPTGGLHFDLGNTTTVGGGVNDLMTISGNLTLDSSSSQIPIFINPLSGTLANGTYTLITYGGSLTGSASDLVLAGAASGGTTRQSFTLSTATPGQINMLVSGAPASLVWKGDGGGNAWDVVTTSDWLNGAAADKFFQFDNVTFNDTTANTTVNIGTLVSPSSIVVDTNQSYTVQGSGTITGATGLTKSGAGTLIVTNSGTNDFTGAVAINGGTLIVGSGGVDGAIGTGSTLTNNGALVINKNLGAANYTIGQAISGTGQLIHRGSGATVLTGSNTYTGATTIEAGRLQITTAAGLGDSTAGTTVNSGAELAVFNTMTMNEPLTINGYGLGGTAATPTGALHTGGSTSVTWAGPITLAGDAAIKIDGNGASLNLPGTVSGTGLNLTLAADGGGNGTVTGTISLGTGSIIKAGTGQWTLATPNLTYSGAIINAGVLQYGNGTVTGNAPLPTGTITLPGGTIAFNNTGSYAVSNTITGAGGVAIGPGGATVTLTGDLSGFTGTIAALSGGTNTPNSTLIVPVATGATSIFIADTNLTGVGQGIIRLTNSNAVANNATLEIDTSQQQGTGRLEIGNASTFNFGTIILHPRNNASATILALDGNNTINGPMRINTGGNFVNLQANAGATLTVTGSIHPAGTVNGNPEGDLPGNSRGLVLGGAGDGTFSGNITNRPDDLTHVGITVFKSGTGTWRLTGTNDYIGNVGQTAANAGFAANAANVVQNGTLVLVGTGAQAPVLSNTNTSAFTDIQGGRLVFDGAAGTDPNIVNTLLSSSFHATGGFNNTTEKIRSSTSNGTLGLGMSYDGASRVTVGFTVFGDANLDGKANALDFNVLANNFGAGSGAFWYQGDFNYDGQVNSMDFSALSQNFNAAAPIPTATPELSTPVLGALVPEPAGLLMAGCALGLMRRRSRRNAR
jgi:autotransporter-associated beta strand protein